MPWESREISVFAPFFAIDPNFRFSFNLAHLKSTLTFIWIYVLKFANINNRILNDKDKSRVSVSPPI